MEMEDAFQKTFTIYPKHLNFLKKINDDNISLALRTVLDSIISGQERTRRKKILDNSLMFICFGFFFFMFTFITDNPYAYLTGLLLGVFLTTYGGIGGVQSALRRTKYHN